MRHAILDLPNEPAWQEAERILFGEPEREGDLPPSRDEIGEMINDVLRRGGPLGPYYRRQDVAIRHLWELMPLEPRARRRAAGLQPFCDLMVAKVALEHIPRIQPGPGALGIELARTARWIAEGRHPRQARAAADMRARASCLEADARRQHRDWSGAERHLTAAFGALPRQADPLSAARLFRTLAALREDQGRLDEAASHLWRAVDLYRKSWFCGEGFACLARLGFIALKRGDIGHAMALFTEVRRGRIGNAYDRRPEVEVDLGRAVCLAAVGLAEPTRQVLAATQPLRRSVHPKGKKAPLEWLECRISARIGNLETAISRLEALRIWLLDQYRPSLLQLCLCTIDLIVAYAKAGSIERRLSRLLRSIAELADAERPTWSQKALWQFCEDAQRRDVDLEDAARRASDEINRAYLSAPVPRARFGARRDDP